MLLLAQCRPYSALTESGLAETLERKSDNGENVEDWLSGRRLNSRRKWWQVVTFANECLDVRPGAHQTGCRLDDARLDFAEVDLTNSPKEWVSKILVALQPGDGQSR